MTAVVDHIDLIYAITVQSGKVISGTPVGLRFFHCHLSDYLGKLCIYIKKCSKHLKVSAHQH